MLYSTRNPFSSLITTTLAQQIASETTSTGGTSPHPAIIANTDPTVEIKPFKFSFRKDDLGNKRATVEIQAAVPNAQGVISILEKGGKGLDYLLEIVQDAMRKQIGSVVSADEKASQANIDWSKLTFDAIANQPREDRRASNISEEDWKAFAEDYISIMPAVTGKNAEMVTNATYVYLKKFNPVKTNKEVLAKLKEQLAIYMDNTKNGEQFTEILDLLNRKLETYMTSDDVELLVQNL